MQTAKIERVYLIPGAKKQEPIVGSGDMFKVEVKAHPHQVDWKRPANRIYQN
jgi:hypothetical protein